MMMRGEEWVPTADGGAPGGASFPAPSPGAGGGDGGEEWVPTADGGAPGGASFPALSHGVGRGNFDRGQRARVRRRRVSRGRGWFPTSGRRGARARGGG